MRYGLWTRAGNARIRRAALLMAALLALYAPAAAELPWPAAPTDGQQALADTVGRTNEILIHEGGDPFNSLFECWPGLAVLGITESEGADHAEGIELTATLSGQDVEMLELRCSDFARFPAICAALIVAVSPATPYADALAAAKGATARVERYPKNSFADEVIQERGDAVGIYFTYEINPYRDEVNWLTVTLIPPRAGGEGGITVTPEPVVTERTTAPTNDDGDSDWVGYFPELDDADHFEIFVTPTPEPDSPVYPFV